MSWKDDARAESLSQFRTAEPPVVADSDLIVMAINRLQRAVVKMQAHEYDDEMNEHLQKASEMLGWVAKNIWMRGDNDPAEATFPPMTHLELHGQLRDLMDSLDDHVDADSAATAIADLAARVERDGLES